jgi:hypothetical protein
MKKPEQKQYERWARLMHLLPGQVAYQRIENTVLSGTPDFAYTIDGVNGWIEFKVAHEPKKESTPVKLRHWSPVQRAWMTNRSESKTVFLVVRVGEYDFLLDYNEMILFETVPNSILTKLFFHVNVKGFVQPTILAKLKDKLRG